MSDDIRSRVEQGKDDLIRQLMSAKAKRRQAAKNPPPAPEEAAEEAQPEAPQDGLSEDDRDALAEMYASLK